MAWWAGSGRCAHPPSSSSRVQLLHQGHVPCGPHGSPGHAAAGPYSWERWAPRGQAMHSRCGLQPVVWCLQLLHADGGICEDARSSEFCCGWISCAAAIAPSMKTWQIADLMCQEYAAQDALRSRAVVASQRRTRCIDGPTRLWRNTRTPHSPTPPVWSKYDVRVSPRGPRKAGTALGGLLGIDRVCLTAATFTRRVAPLLPRWRSLVPSALRLGPSIDHSQRLHHRRRRAPGPATSHPDRGLTPSLLCATTPVASLGFNRRQ